MLNGRAGDDVLVGGAGADTFILERGTGAERIGDFAPGTDHLLLSGLGFGGFAQVLAATIEQDGTTVIDLGSGDLVTLAGVAKVALLANDILLPFAASSAFVKPGPAKSVPTTILAGGTWRPSPAPLPPNCCKAAPGMTPCRALMAMTRCWPAPAKTASMVAPAATASSSTGRRRATPSPSTCSAPRWSAACRHQRHRCRACLTAAAAMTDWSAATAMTASPAARGMTRCRAPPGRIAWPAARARIPCSAGRAPISSPAGRGPTASSSRAAGRWTAASPRPTASPISTPPRATGWCCAARRSAPACTGSPDAPSACPITPWANPSCRLASAGRWRRGPRRWPGSACPIRQRGAAYHLYWQPGLSAGGWLLLDVDRDGLLGAADLVVRVDLGGRPVDHRRQLRRRNLRHAGQPGGRIPSPAGTRPTASSASAAMTGWPGSMAMTPWRVAMGRTASRAASASTACSVARAPIRWTAARHRCARWRRRG